MVDDSRLPDRCDALIPVKQLVHGKHNPRKVEPSDELRADIEQNGILDAIVVREEGDTYHVTDGWQRYQAAVEAGFDELPVDIYEGQDALDITQSESLGREYDRLDWIRLAESYAELLGLPDMKASHNIVKDKMRKSPRTVKRYLNASELPDLVLETLVAKDDRATDRQWNELSNWYSGIQRGDSVTLQVASKLGAEADDIDDDRVRELAAHLTDYNNEGGQEFLNLAFENPEMPVSEVHKLRNQTADTDDNLSVRGIEVSVNDSEHKAFNRFCEESRQQPKDVTQSLVQEFVDALNSENPPKSVSEFVNN